MVPQAGIEPTAYPLGEGRSIQLSYWGAGPLREDAARSAGRV